MSASVGLFISLLSLYIISKTTCPNFTKFSVTCGRAWHCPALTTIEYVTYFSFLGLPFVKRFALCYRTIVCPVCDVGGFVAKRLDGSRCHLTWWCLDPGHIVLDGDPAPLRKGAQHPLFSVHICCGQTVAHLSNC